MQEQNQLAATRGQIPRSLIAIYKALGGGWQIRYDGFASEAPLQDFSAEAEPIPLGDEPGSVPLDPAPPIIEPLSPPNPTPPSLVPE